MEHGQRVEVQLGLIDTATGQMLFEPEEHIIENEHSFCEMTVIAKDYGVELGRLLRASKLTQDGLDRLIVCFVRGMSACRPLSTEERAWLADDVFNAAQPWLGPN